MARSEQDSALSDAAYVASLHAQVDRLQQKLGELHCSDLSTLKRAHTSLSQHIKALDVESKHIGNLVAQLDTQLLTVDFVAQEISWVAGVAGSVWALDRGLRMLYLPVSRGVTQAMTAAAVAFLAWRMSRRGSQRLAGLLEHNKRVKAQLLADWQAVEERMAIMRALVAAGSTAP